MLLEQPGHLVEKDALMKAVWPDSFVEENNLADNISRLRKALGEGENGQKFIETIPKRGYRFVAGVKELSSASAATVVTPPPPMPGLSAVNGKGATGEQAAAALAISEQPSKKLSLRARIKWRQRRVFLVCGLFIIAAAVPIYLSLKSRWQMPRVMRYAKITSDGRMKGFEYTYSRVTDGSRVYFSEALGGGKIVLAEVSSAGGESVPVQPSIEGARLTAISPDRSRLLVTWSEFGGGEQPLWIVPVTGGSPYRVGDVLAHAATWTPNGEWITYANGHDLFQVRNDGSGARKLVGLPDWVTWPRWSPDGSRLRFTMGGPKLWEVAANGTNPHPYSDDPSIKRVRITDRKVEWVADLKELRLVVLRPYGSWFGLAPDDSPLVLRDVGLQDIYALDFQTP